MIHTFCRVVRKFSSGTTPLRRRLGAGTSGGSSITRFLFLVGGSGGGFGTDWKDKKIKLSDLVRCISDSHHADLQRVLVVFWVQNCRNRSNGDARFHLGGHQRVGQLHTQEPTGYATIRTPYTFKAKSFQKYCVLLHLRQDVDAFVAPPEGQV